MLALPILAWALLVYGDPEEGAVLAKLHDVYLSRIRPVERKFKYTDLGRGTVTEQEIYAKPIVTLLRPGTASNAAFTLLLDDNEHRNNDDRITILESGSFHDERDLPSDRVSELLPIAGTGPECSDAFRHVTSAADLLHVVTMVDIPFTSRFVDQEYRKSCTEMVGNTFRKTDLFILLLTWNDIKLPQNLVTLLQKVDPEQSEMIVVITDFDKTLKPDFAEAYREVLWMLQPFFPRGGAPEVFLIPLHESGEANAYANLQREALHKKLWSLRDRTLNLKVNRIFRYARQLDEHISTLQRYLEAYVSRNEELIRELTTDPRKFGVFDECDSTCQKTKEYQHFFSVNPIQEMANLLDDCKKLRYSAAAVERSFMEELLPVATRAKLSVPKTDAEASEGETEPSDVENEASEYATPTFDSPKKGFEGTEDHIAREVRKIIERSTEFASEETESGVFSESEDEPESKDDVEESDGLEEKETAEQKKEEQEKEAQKDEEKETKRTKNRPEVDASEDSTDKPKMTGRVEKVEETQRTVDEAKKPANPKNKPAQKSTAWSGADATPAPVTKQQKTRQETGKKRNSRTPCKFRKNCVEEISDEQPTGFHAVWNLLPNSIREAASLLPFDTEPFFEQAEQLLEFLPELHIAGAAQRQSQERSWCKYRSRCREAMEKTGKVPEEFVRQMKQTMSHNKPPSTVASLAVKDAKASCKYRKSCSEASAVKEQVVVAKATPKKAKPEKKPKKTNQATTDGKKAKKTSSDSVSSKPSKKSKSKKDETVVDINDSRCKFYKTCKEKLEKLQPPTPKKGTAKDQQESGKSEQKQPPPPSTAHRPYSVVESDEKCRFRKSCKGEQPKKTAKAPATKPKEQKSAPKPKVSRPYLDGKPHKCQFSKSCDPEAKAAARSRKTEKPKTEKVPDAKTTKAPSVVRPYTDGGHHKCQFSKSCNRDEKAANKAANAEAAAKRSKAATKDAEAKPLTVRPYANGGHVKCQFSKSCGNREKREPKAQPKPQQATKNEKPKAPKETPVKTRPYMKGGLHKCQFSKTCDPEAKAAAKKAAAMKAETTTHHVHVIRPYVGDTATGDCRFRKSCKEPTIPPKILGTKPRKPEHKTEVVTPKAPKPAKPAFSKSTKKEVDQQAGEDVVTGEEDDNVKMTKEVQPEIPVENRAEKKQEKKRKTDGLSQKDKKKPEERPKKSPKEDTKKVAKPTKQPVSRPSTATKRPYVGDESETKGNCRFRKSCQKEQAQKAKVKQQKDSKQRTTIDEAPVKHVIRPYSEGDTVERDCRFKKSCRSETATKPKVKSETKKTEKQAAPKSAPAGSPRPYTSGSGYKDCRFMKSCAENEKRKQVKQAKQAAAKKPEVTQQHTTSTKPRPYAEARSDEKCQFRKSCKGQSPEKVKKQVPKPAAKTEAKKVANRPYVTGHVKCQFSKSCADKEDRSSAKQKENSKRFEKIDKVETRHVIRPYSSPLKPGEECRFRKSCNDQPKTKPSPSGKVEKKVKEDLSSKDIPTAPRAKKAFSKDRKETEAEVQITNEKPKQSIKDGQNRFTEAAAEDVPEKNNDTNSREETEDQDEESVKQEDGADEVKVRSDKQKELVIEKDPESPREPSSENQHISNAGDSSKERETEDEDGDAEDESDDRERQVSEARAKKQREVSAKPSDNAAVEEINAEQEAKSEDFRDESAEDETVETAKDEVTEAKQPRAAKPQFSRTAKEAKTEGPEIQDSETPTPSPKPVKPQFSKSARKEKPDAEQPEQATGKPEVRKPVVKPVKPQFSKSAKTEKPAKPATPKKEAQLQTKQVIRPYSKGDRVRRKCQFRKSCEKEETTKTPTEGKQVVTTRPYVANSIPRPCRFRKSCDVEVAEQLAQKSKECRFRKCGENPTPKPKVESGPIFDTDESGMSILASARGIAANAFSSLFSPSRRYPLNSPEGGELDAETILEYQQRKSRNKSALGQVLSHIVGGEHSDYGCNVFHKRCRNVLGMPPLKAGKVEKQKKKCRRRKKKQT